MGLGRLLRRGWLYSTPLHCCVGARFQVVSVVSSVQTHMMVGVLIVIVIVLIVVKAVHKLQLLTGREINLIFILERIICIYICLVYHTRVGIFFSSPT